MKGSDLVITTDFRQVLAETAYRTTGVGNLEPLVPQSRCRLSELIGIIQVKYEGIKLVTWRNLAGSPRRFDPGALSSRRALLPLQI